MYVYKDKVSEEGYEALIGDIWVLLLVEDTLDKLQYWLSNDSDINI